MNIKKEDENKEKELEENITKWSEGNEELKKCLYFMNKNEYKTHACCSGHPERNLTKPYISFVFNKKEENNILYYILIDRLLKRGQKIELTNFVSLEGDKYIPRFSVYFDMEDQYNGFKFITENAKEIFENINLTNQRKKKQNQNEKNLKSVKKTNGMFNLDKNIQRVIDFFLKYGETNHMYIDLGEDDENVYFVKYKKDNFINLEDNLKAKKMSEFEIISEKEEDGKFISVKTNLVDVRYKISFKNIFDVFKLD